MRLQKSSCQHVRIAQESIVKALAMTSDSVVEAFAIHHQQTSKGSALYKTKDLKDSQPYVICVPDSGVFGMVGLGEKSLAPGFGGCFRVLSELALVITGSR